jgi:hypothetical protein
MSSLAYKVYFLNRIKNHTHNHYDHRTHAFISSVRCHAHHTPISTHSTSGFKAKQTSAQSGFPSTQTMGLAAESTTRANCARLLKTGEWSLSTHSQTRLSLSMSWALYKTPSGQSCVRPCTRLFKASRMQLLWPTRTWGMMTTAELETDFQTVPCTASARCVSPQ